MAEGKSFLDMHQDFVLKLKFVGDGDVSQIRRVRLPRIAKDGQVSYEELVGLAISFVVPEYPAGLTDYQVKLTYQDVDDDTIVMGSSEELFDAIEQFSDQRVLGLTAEVKRFTKAKPQQGGQSKNWSRASSERGTKTNNAGTQANGSGPPPIIQNVVESVVDIILKAAVAVNGHGRANTAHPYYSPDGVPVEPADSTAPRAAAAPAAPAEIPDSAESKATENLAAGLKNPPAEPSPEVNPSPAVADAADAEAERQVKEERPFIHGRHTCDCCLTTPVIGKRFHAVNMADYDLCEKCFKNYKGSEIQFEAVELDRDRYLQDRWHGRRDRMNRNRGGPGRRPVPPGHHMRRGPGPGPRGPRGGPHFGPTHVRGRFHGQQGPPPPFPLPSPPSPQEGPTICPESGPKGGDDRDLAMDEAIRRSLQDFVRNKKLESPPQPSAPLEEEEEEEKEEAGTLVAEAAASIRSSTEQVAEKHEEPVTTQGTVNSENTKEVVKRSTETPRDSMGHVDAVPEEIADTVDNDATVDFTTSFEVQSPPGGSFASEVSDVNKEGSFLEKDEEEEMTLEPSFSEAGNGDVADLLGSTLDQCARAIDAMVTELDRAHSSQEYGNSSYISSCVGVDQEGAQEGKELECKEEEEKTLVVDDEATEGATILESADGPKEKAEERASVEECAAVEDGWQVVSDDNQINNDEELALAAQMVGSALFNSDMKSSGGVVSTLTSSAAGSDAFSHASSVPTSVASISSVSAAQFERWSLQLTQLHEMGFDDDAACIEVLEKLTAANIGCDSAEEISVQQVINELWRN